MLNQNKLQATTRTLAALAAGLMFCLLALSSRPANADQAISEVWSEGDGLKMKYSTHHDDLLGVKGSELSLSTDRKEVAHSEEPAAASGGQEEGSSSPANSEQESDSGATSSASSDEQSSTGGENNEQGADSSSRQVEKVPPAGRVQSYSSVASNQQHVAASLPRQHRPSSKATRNHDDDDDAIPPPVPSSRLQSYKSSPSRTSAASNQVNQESPLSFDSAYEHSETPGEGDSTANVDRGQSEGESSSSGDSVDHSNSLNARFRQPSRLFKEAVRMNSNNDEQSHSKPSGSTSAVDESGESNDSSSSSSDDNTNGQEGSRSSGGDEQETKGDNEEAAAAAPPESSGGEDDSAFQSSQQRQLKRQPNMMIDHSFDAPSPSRPTSAGADEDDEPTKRLSAGSNPNRNSNGAYNSAPMDDDETPANFLRPNSGVGQFFDHSGQSRAALATGHKERVQSISPASQRKPAVPASARTPNQGYKQLAYFRGVAEQQQQQQLAGAAPRSRQASSSFRPPVSFDGPPDVRSPDSVRDNFISPGHFPGSMPHLTQAASEITQKSNGQQSAQSAKVESAASTAAATATPLGQTDPSPSSQLVASDSNPDYKNVPSPVVADEKDSPKVAANAELEPQQQQANEIVQVVSTVTPEPESVSEGQNQIMSPILLSTTTMAPMQPTSAAPSPSSTTTSTTSTSTTTTAPSLKRFKFRKYR